MNTKLVGITAVLLVLFAAAVAQSPDRRTQFHVTSSGLPASLTVPSTIEGRSLNNRNVNVEFVVIANTDPANVQTVTIQDCQMTPFKLASAYPIQPLQTWFIPLGGATFVGCIKWSASSTNVMGSIVGE